MTASAPPFHRPPDEVPDPHVWGPIRDGGFRCRNLPSVSYSEMFAFGVCRQKHHWIYRRGIEPKIDAPRPTFGSAGHYGLEALYQGRDLREAMNNWLLCTLGDIPLFDEERQVYEEIADTLKLLLPRYARHYAEDKLRTVGCEVEFNVKLPGFGVRLTGFWDALVEESSGKLWIMDHKFVTPGSGFRTEWELEMDLQVGVYHWAARQIGLPVVGTIYNQIRAQLPQIPQLLKNGSAMSRSLIATDWPTYRAALVTHGLDPNDYDDMLVKLSQRRWFDRVYLPRDDTQLDAFWQDMFQRVWDMRRRRSIVYMTPNRINCSPCPYRDLCLEVLAGRDPEGAIESGFQPRRRREARRPPEVEEVPHGAD